MTYARGIPSVCQYETERGRGIDHTTKVEVYTVKLVDRRSGTVIDSKDFDAPGECPSSISSSTQVWFEFDTAEDWVEVKQWLASKLAG